MVRVGLCVAIPSLWLFELLLVRSRCRGKDLGKERLAMVEEGVDAEAT